MDNQLTEKEKQILLRIARDAVTAAASAESLPSIRGTDFEGILAEEGASFVTLTKAGTLRGCIGALDAYQPLVEDVQEHAVAAATEDYRFPNVRLEEVPMLSIEISRLTAPQPLEYESPQELMRLVRPHIDGVVFKTSGRRATFLPQVWEKVTDHQEFFSHLCMKMGVPADLWKRKKLTVLVYQVEEFCEL